MSFWFVQVDERAGEPAGLFGSSSLLHEAITTSEQSPKGAGVPGLEPQHVPNELALLPVKFLKPESDFESDLKIGDLTSLELTPHADHFEPVDIAKVSDARSMPLRIAASVPSATCPRSLSGGTCGWTYLVLLFSLLKVFLLRNDAHSTHWTVVVSPSKIC